MSPYQCPVIAVHTTQSALFTNHHLTVRMCDAPATKVLEPRGTNCLPCHEMFPESPNVLISGVVTHNCNSAQAQTRVTERSGERGPGTSILSEADKPSTVMAYQCARRRWGKGRRVHTSSCRMTALSDSTSVLAGMFWLIIGSRQNLPQHKKSEP